MLTCGSSWCPPVTDDLLCMRCACRYDTRLFVNECWHFDDWHFAWSNLPRILPSIWYSKYATNSRCSLLRDIILSHLPHPQLTLLWNDWRIMTSQMNSETLLFQHTFFLIRSSWVFAVKATASVALESPKMGPPYNDPRWWLLTSAIDVYMYRRHCICRNIHLIIRKQKHYMLRGLWMYYNVPATVYIGFMWNG